MIAVNQSRCATHTGSPTASAAQNHGPMGHRNPRCWWGTVPAPMLGSQRLAARARNAAGSRYRYWRLSAEIFPGSDRNDASAAKATSESAGA